MINVRENTNKVCDMAEDGMISWRDLAVMALSWMSEDDVTAMCRANDILIDDEE